MNAFDILKTWPGMVDATPEDIFSHPAWAMPCQWGDERCVLRKAAAKPRDVIGIAIALDDEEHFLGIANRDSFPDLHDLWARKTELPPSLILALIEKECGDLLQLIENAVRRQVRVIGLDDSSKRSGGLAFEAVSLADGVIRASFVLDIRPPTVRNFGQLRFLDVRHPSVREMERMMHVVYASFGISDDERSGLAAGDRLMLPELSDGVAGEWMCAVPDDGRFRVMSRNGRPVSFAELADDSLPPISAPCELELRQGDNVIARGRFGKLCESPAFIIEEVL